MKFIIPQNYNFNKKLFGIINYSTLILDIIWGGSIFIILDLIVKKINIKIFLFIIFTLPVFIVSIVGVSGENLINVIIYISKFLFRQKIFFYNKSTK